MLPILTLHYFSAKWRTRRKLTTIFNCGFEAKLAIYEISMGAKPQVIAKLTSWQEIAP